MFSVSLQTHGSRLFCQLKRNFHKTHVRALYTYPSDTQKEKLVFAPSQTEQFVAAFALSYGLSQRCDHIRNLLAPTRTPVGFWLRLLF